MISLSARRYSPNKSADLQEPVMAALDHNWCNTAAVAGKLRRPSDDGSVRYCLAMLTKAELIERTSVQGLRGIVYLYRRKA
jgi:hypothetical protein